MRTARQLRRARRGAEFAGPDLMSSHVCAEPARHVRQLCPCAHLSRPLLVSATPTYPVARHTPPHDGHYPRYHGCPPRRGLPCLRGRPRTRHRQGAASELNSSCAPQAEGRASERVSVGVMCSTCAAATCIDVHARRFLPAANSLSPVFPLRGVGRRPQSNPSSLANPDRLQVAYSSASFFHSCGAPGRIGWAGWRSVSRPARPRKGTWSSPDSKLCKVETPVIRAARSCVLLAPACALPGIQKPRWLRASHIPGPRSRMSSSHIGRVATRPPRHKTTPDRAPLRDALQCGRFPTNRPRRRPAQRQER